MFLRRLTINWMRRTVQIRVTSALLNNPTTVNGNRMSAKRAKRTSHHWSTALACRAGLKGTRAAVTNPKANSQKTSGVPCADKWATEAGLQTTGQPHA